VLPVVMLRGEVGSKCLLLDCDCFGDPTLPPPAAAEGVILFFLIVVVEVVVAGFHAGSEGNVMLLKSAKLAKSPNGSSFLGFFGDVKLRRGCPCPPAPPVGVTPELAVMVLTLVLAAIFGEIPAPWKGPDDDAWWLNPLLPDLLLLAVVVLVVVVPLLLFVVAPTPVSVEALKKAAFLLLPLLPPALSELLLSLEVEVAGGCSCSCGGGGACCFCFAEE